MTDATEIYAKDASKLVELRQKFAPLCIPTQEDFAELIELAATPFHPGHGLTPVAVSEQAGIGPDADTDLTVMRAYRGGLELSSDDQALRLAPPALPFTGIPLALSVRVDSGLTTENGLAVKINLKNGLAPVTGNSPVALISPAETRSGLTLEGGLLALRVDNQALKNDSKGVHVLCRTDGGLTIDNNGIITIDLDFVLKLIAKN